MIEKYPSDKLNNTGKQSMTFSHKSSKVRVETTLPKNLKFETMAPFVRQVSTKKGYLEIQIPKKSEINSTPNKKIR